MLEKCSVRIRNPLLYPLSYGGGMEILKSCGIMRCHQIVGKPF